MKKSLLIVMMMPMMMFGDWSEIYHEYDYDELKGDGGYHSYSYGYSSKNCRGRVITYDTSDSHQIKVICPTYSFFKSSDETLGEAMTKYIEKSIDYDYLPQELRDGVYKKRREYNSSFCVAKVGFYKDGNLVKRGNMIVELSSGTLEFGYLMESQWAGITSEEIEKKYPTKNKNLHYLERNFNLTMHQQIYYMQELSSVKKIDIYNALSHTNMSVRIIIPCYGKGSDFDVTIVGDELFTKLSWIPANKKRLEMEAQKRAEETIRKKIAEEAEKKAREEEAAHQAKVSRLKELEAKYPELEAKAKRCEENGYTFTLKKVKDEMKSINEEISKLKRELGVELERNSK